MYEVGYGTEMLQYFIIRSDRAKMALVVHPNMKIVVHAPHAHNVQEVEKFLRKKWLWINAKLSEFEKYKKTKSVKEFVSGESFYYLGRQYMLKVESGDIDEVRLAKGRIQITTTSDVRSSEHNKLLFSEWLSKRTEKVFAEVYKKAIVRFDLENTPKLRTRKMNKRWGSHSKGWIALNPNLIEASKHQIEYVLVHELCHTVQDNHSDKFYALLLKKMPDWKIHKQELEIKHG